MDPSFFGSRGVNPLANREYPLRGSQRASSAGAAAASAGRCGARGTGQPPREGAGLRRDPAAAERRIHRGSRRIAGAAGRVVVVGFFLQMVVERFGISRSNRKK